MVRLTRLGRRFASGFTTKAGRRRMFGALFAAVGFAVALAQGIIWMADIEDNQGVPLLITVSICVAGALIVGLPPARVAARMPQPPRAAIELRRGDLLASPHPIAIGISDWVDVDFPERLHPSTLIGQLWTSASIGSLGDLRDLLWAQSAKNIDEPLDLGTIASIPRRRGGDAYVIVFAEIHQERTTSTPIRLLQALEALWDRVRHDKLIEIHLPVLGSGFGGSRLQRAALLSIIAMSYTLASDKAKVCDRLVIHVAESDYAPSEFTNFAETLSGLGYL